MKSGPAATLLVLILTAAAVFVPAWAGHVFRGEFMSSSDEPTHLMNGLLVRDYLAGGFPSSPLAFAKKYYLHYPKIAIGMWGIVQPLSLGLWTLLFSCSPVSIVMFMLTTAVLLAFLTFRIASRVLVWWAAVSAGLMVALNQLVLLASHSVMADLLVALNALLAAMFLIRYLDKLQTRDVLLYSFFAVLSALTKASGLAMFLVPFCAVLFTRNWRVLLRPPFWVALGLAVSVVLPWQMKSSALVRGMVAVPPLNAHSIFHNGSVCLWAMWESMGAGLGLLFLLGFWERVGARWRMHGVDNLWAVAASLPLCVVGFHIIQPFPVVSRHVVAAIPGLMLLAAAGMERLADILPRPRTAAVRAIGVLCVTAVCFGVEAFQVHPKASYGIRDAVGYLAGRLDLKESVFLVSGMPEGEGGFVSEVALSERRPGHIALRASKIISRSTWDGQRFELLTRTPPELMQRLEHIPVGVVAIVKTQPPIPEQRILTETLNAYTSRWKPLGAFGNGAVELYELTGHQSLPRHGVEIDMHYSLGEPIRQP
jgi:hypothetical protein